MEASVAEQQGEGLDQTITHASQPEEVIFRSRGTHFRAVVQASRRVPTESGGWHFIPGEACDFAPNAEFRTRDPRIIEYLRGLTSCGTEFFEVGNEPGRIPSGEAVVNAIMEALVELDDARLAAIEQEELGQFRREDVLVAVRGARAQAQRMLEAQAQAPAEEPAPPAEGAGSVLPQPQWPGAGL